MVARQEWKPVMTNVGRAAVIPKVPPIVANDGFIDDAPTLDPLVQDNSAIYDTIFNESAGDPPIISDSISADPTHTDSIASDPVEIDPVEIDPVEIDPIEIDPVQIDPVKFNPIDIDHAGVDHVGVDHVDPVENLLYLYSNSPLLQPALDPVSNLVEPTVDSDTNADCSMNADPQDEIFVDAYADIPDSEFNFDVDIDDIDDLSVPLPVSAATSTPVSAAGTSSSKVQSRTSSQEGGDVVENSTSAHKQPIEVEYNLPSRYNPNKRRFKPQLLNKKKKKTRLNLIGTRLLPLGKVRYSYNSSRHNTQSDSSI
ncbi:hypothetical protein BD560DRAFT_429379 [Blakeslea trispora]|nr:hypothetical protein BD560DRAFT_429379 [Blakeslea trispora]